MTLIPPQYRLIAAAVLCAALVAGGVAAGVKLGRVMEKAALSGDLLEKSNSIERLSQELASAREGIQKCNAATDLAAAQTEAAKAIAAEAKKRADILAGQSIARLDKLGDLLSKATDCDAVLKGYWEMRQ